jgi:hypothetical protein
VAALKLVTVSVPEGVVMTVPWAIVVPLMVTAAGLSPGLKVTVPLVVSVLAAAFEPADSPDVPAVPIRRRPCRPRPRRAAK